MRRWIWVAVYLVFAAATSGEAAAMPASSIQGVRNVDGAPASTRGPEGTRNGLARTKDGWDKALILARIAGPLLVGVVVAVAGYLINRANERRQQRVSAIQVVNACLPSLSSVNEHERQIALVAIEQLGEDEWGETIAALARRIVEPTSVNIIKFERPGELALYGWLASHCVRVVLSKRPVTTGLIIGRWLVFPCDCVDHGGVFIKGRLLSLSSRKMVTWTPFDLAHYRLPTDQGEPPLSFETDGFVTIAGFYGEGNDIRLISATLEPDLTEPNGLLVCRPTEPVDLRPMGFLVVRPAKQQILGMVCGGTHEELLVIQAHKLRERATQCEPSLGR